MNRNLFIEVNQKMREAETAWNKLLTLNPAGQSHWSDAQLKELAILSEIIKKHHNVLLRIVKAYS